jgi:hypothetical protein
MNKPYANHDDPTGQTTAGVSVVLARLIQKLFLAGLALVTGALLAPSALAQGTGGSFVRARGPQFRITVPAGYVGTQTLTNMVEVGGITTNPVSLYVAGLPSGCTTNLTDGLGNDVFTTGQGTSLWLSVNMNGVAAGTYPFTLNMGNASGGGITNHVTNHLNFVLEVAKMWVGNTNGARDGKPLWTDGAQWTSSGTPGASDDVVFQYFGGQTNIYFTNAGPTIDYLTTVTLPSSQTISSLRLAGSTNNTLNNMTFDLADNNLSVTGSKGLSIWRNYIAEFWAGLGTPSIAIMGTNSTLLVSNSAAKVSLLIDGQANVAWDMSRLGTFKSDVSRVGLGDWTHWPDYDNYLDNNYNGVPRRHIGTVILARTNVIRATFKDSANYNDPQRRPYAFSVGASPMSGTTAFASLWLGVTNAFLMDSVCLGGAQQSANLRFWPGYATNYACVATFRSTNGTGRMSTFTVTDAAGTNGMASNEKATIDFREGTVDMLVDRLYVSRDRDILAYNQQPSLQGFLYFGNGTIDANEVVLGYEQYSHSTNVNGGDGHIRAYCQGYLTLSNSTFKVNSNLTLGYTTFEPDADDSNNYGRIWVGDNGTLMANRINVNHGTNVAGADNWIVASNRSTVILTNTLGGTNKMLSRLTFANGTLTLHLDASKTNPYVYVTNTVTTSGTSNALKIAQLNNFTTTTHLPIFAFDPAASTFGAAFDTIILPGSYRAAPWEVPGSGAGDLGIWGIDVLTNPPKNLLWKGQVSANWNTVTTNWWDMTALKYTNFTTGDNVAFDDSATSFTVTLVNPSGGTLVPSVINMTNTTAYVFNGSGRITGSPQWTKRGTGGLELDSITTAVLHVLAGTFTGNGGGAVSSAEIDTGARMDFNGNISAGLSSSGASKFGGSMNGPLTVGTGGTVTNMGNMVVSAVTLQNASILVNSNTINYQGGLSVSSNSFFLNAGNLEVPSGRSLNDQLTVENGGTFRDDGFGNITVNRLTVGAGGTFIPGGLGIASTIVYGNGVGTSAGRVLFAQASTNVFKVRPSTAQTTKLLVGSGFMDFGASASTENYNGGVIQIQNLNGATAFTNGQVFGMFGNADDVFSPQLVSTGTATNTYPNMLPNPPKMGLYWDLRNLRYLANDTSNGIIWVRTVATNATNFLTFSLAPEFEVFSTNYTTNASVITTNYVTNDYVYTTVEWPSNHTGWRLLSQARQLTDGLHNGEGLTNWTEVFRGRWTNMMLLTNTYSTNAAVFYWMVYP